MKQQDFVGARLFVLIEQTQAGLFTGVSITLSAEWLYKCDSRVGDEIIKTEARDNNSSLVLFCLTSEQSL